MPSFDKLFASVIGSQSVDYEGKKLIRLDYILFKNGDKFKITFEKKNSEWKQGVLLSLWGHFEITGEKFNNRIVLWEDTAPPETIITIFENNSTGKQPKRLPEKGILSIKNVWDTGDGVIESWYNGAAMVAEEIENGRRYKCNDGHPDDNFDDIVFTIQKI